jgi:hypothetical protein
LISVRPGTNAGGAFASSTSEKRGIPFDYAFRYELKGETGNVINSVVTVSIEATFTALSIGYGVIPKVEPIVFGPQLNFPFIPTVPRTLSNLEIGEVLRGLPNLVVSSRAFRNETGVEAVFKNGIKLNPQVADVALANNGTATLSENVLSRLFQVVGSPSDQVQFKYAIFDEGSGREFQSEPILNIAGLGSANGERPFRYFAQPIVFRPRSTIRMEVTEVSDFAGELHVSLHGYKMLGDSNSPTAAGPTRRGLRRR